jgi:threonine efflux protein
VSPTATLLYVAAVHWAAMASPGPNVLLVARTAMADSRRAALSAAAGVACGAVLLATAAAFGLGLLVEQLSWLRTALQLAGGLYLIFLGVQTWRSARETLRVGGTGDRSGAHFRRGLLTNLSNPKAAVFFGSILAPTLDAGVSGWVALAAIGVIAVDALVWHCVLAVLFARPGVRRGYARAKSAIDRVVGAALALLGIRLAWEA